MDRRIGKLKKWGEGGGLEEDNEDKEGPIDQRKQAYKETRAEGRTEGRKDRKIEKSLGL
jgi:hypothetical protein